MTKIIIVDYSLEIVIAPLGNNFSTNFLESLPFKIVRDHFTYLGLVIPLDPKDIFKLNFSSAIKSLKSTIEKWRLLPLSLIGRVNAIKMVVLPRFLYLFQNLPIYLTKSFFKNLDSIIFPFIWSFKSHRIAKAHLEKSKEMGWAGNASFSTLLLGCKLKVFDVLEY